MRSGGSAEMTLLDQSAQIRCDVDSVEMNDRSSSLCYEHFVARLWPLQPVLKLPTKLSYSHFWGAPDKHSPSWHVPQHLTPPENTTPPSPHGRPPRPPTRVVSPGQSHLTASFAARGSGVQIPPAPLNSLFRGISDRPSARPTGAHVVPALHRWPTRHCGNPLISCEVLSHYTSRQIAWMGSGAKHAGIDKRISPQMLRHSFITAALDSGVSLRDVQEAAPHADPRTTMRYDERDSPLTGMPST
jgi:hypothetical protein